MTEHSTELRWYLILEQAIPVLDERDEECAAEVAAIMDEIWYDLSADERAWINARGEMKP